MTKDWWEGLDVSGTPSLLTTTEVIGKSAVTAVWHVAWVSGDTAYRVRVEGPAMETHPLTPAANDEWDRLLGRGQRVR